MFSNEILYLIFCHFESKRYLTNCSSVCKQWYSVAIDPVFYRHISIYTTKQLKLFIRFATNITCQQKPLGHFVNHIEILFKESVQTLILINLQQCCPFIQYIDYPQIKLNNFAWEDWHHIKRLPKGLYRVSNSTIQSLSSTLEYIYLCLKNIPDHGSPERSFNNLLNFFTTTTNLQELYLNFYYQNMDIFYFDTIHSACPALTKLTIINAIIDNNDNSNSGNIDNNDNNGSNNSALRRYQPRQCQILNRRWDKIVYLRFKNITIQDPLLFSIIMNSHPNLESMILEKISCISQEESDQFRSAIRDFINLEQLPNLKLFKITFDKSYTCFRKMWPHDEFLQWLHNHPQQLTTLELPSSIIPSTISTPSSIETPPIGFIEFLHTLTLNISNTTQSTTNTLKYLLNSYQTIPTHLKSLTIIASRTNDNANRYNRYNQYNRYHRYNRYYSEDEDEREHIDYKPIFPIYDWLKAVPSLHSLTLNGLFIKDKDDTSEQQQQQQHKALRECVFDNCTIKMTGGLNCLCEYAPNIEILKCNIESLYYYSDMDIVNDDQGIDMDSVSILYAPQLSLKEFDIHPHRCLPLNYTKNISFVKVTLNTSSTNEDGDLVWSQHHHYGKLANMIIVVHTIDRLCIGDSWVVY
ncbi:hypothetical protein BJ944DRAFT_258205 [Cunninghamella echinulata]|nr:hypothetical protein BJ944DRAFT_258205 [Cunninghamella echinulata]